MRSRELLALGKPEHFGGQYMIFFFSKQDPKPRENGSTLVMVRCPRVGEGALALEGFLRVRQPRAPWAARTRPSVEIEGNSVDEITGFS